MRYEEETFTFLYRSWIFRKDLYNSSTSFACINCGKTHTNSQKPHIASDSWKFSGQYLTLSADQDTRYSTTLYPFCRSVLDKNARSSMNSAHCYKT